MKELIDWDDWPETVSLKNSFVIERKTNLKDSDLFLRGKSKMDIGIHNVYKIIISKYKCEIHCLDEKLKEIVKRVIEPIYRTLIFGKDEIGINVLITVITELAQLVDAQESGHISMSTVI